MKILHTSDWHLGHRLHQNERSEEQNQALDWLFEVIVEYKVEVLLVAGDIYDQANPPSYAQEAYYRFLSRLIGTSCKTIIVTAGNHDSPTAIEASSTILRLLNIHVVGQLPSDLEELLIPIKNHAGDLEAVVAAVPFLRERDLPRGDISDDLDERRGSLRKGIKAIYDRAAEAAQASYASIPLIGMGHLFAQGAKIDEEKKSSIYLGDVENISAEAFSQAYNYVALGHIHRPQMVGKQDRIRYCGSLLPLDFAETGDKKQVLLLDLAGGKLQIEPIYAPVFRLVRRKKGTLAELEKQVVDWLKEPTYADTPPTPWLELTPDPPFTNELEAEQWKQYIQTEYNVWISYGRAKLSGVGGLSSNAISLEQLNELDPMEVFEKRLEVESFDENDKQLMKNLFSEIIESMRNE
jgi:DNA repair protein SbcD/Mre11